MKQYVISERNYEYNDEGYSSTSGGTPIKIIINRNELDSIVKELNCKFVRKNREYLCGSSFDLDFCDKFGKDNFHIYGNYATIDYDADFSKLSDELCLELLTLIHEEPYIVTELNCD
jgi:hypothetical protein